MEFKFTLSRSYKRNLYETFGHKVCSGKINNHHLKADFNRQNGILQLILHLFSVLGQP
jgi:hypothetical protein